MSKPLVPPSADKSFGEIRGTTLHRCSGHELQNTDTIRFAELKHNPELQNRAAKSKTITLLFAARTICAITRRFCTGILARRRGFEVKIIFVRAEPPKTGAGPSGAEHQMAPCDRFSPHREGARDHRRR